MNDLDNAPISDKDRTLYAFIRKMVRDSTSIGQEDVDVARKAGWSDEALYDAITVCSLFQFYNNWIDATGVGNMPAFGYEMSGHRLATQGYAREPQPESRSEAAGSKTSIATKASKKPNAANASRKSKRPTAKASQGRRRR